MIDNEIKRLEEELSEKEGMWIKILSIRGKHVTICTYATYLLMKKMGFIKEE